jgi:hypothetical protein
LALQVRILICSLWLGFCLDGKFKKQFWKIKDEIAEMVNDKNQIHLTQFEKSRIEHDIDMIEKTLNKIENDNKEWSRKCTADELIKKGDET